MGVPKIIDLKTHRPKGREWTKITQWSNLPTDLLQQIMAELILVDQIRFRSVCKNWLSLPFQETSREMEKLPWLLTFDWYGPQQRSQIHWKLFDPIHKYTDFRLSTARDTAEDFVHRRPFSRISKHGWVFFSTENMDTGHASFVLFSPFTNKIMTLPDLHHGVQKTFDVPKKIAFSSNPTSKDCVFFILYNDDNNKAVVGTYKHGDKAWITKRLHRSVVIESMVSFQGKLHCLHGSGSLSVYDHVAKQDWDFSLNSLKYECEKYNYIENHLVESNGELLEVCINRRFDSCGIYTFNRTGSDWVEKTSLLNRALFISRNSISIPAVGDMKHMENKIFYHDRYREKGKFNSLTDDQSYYCEGTEYECLFMKENFVRGIWIDCPSQFARQQCEAIESRVEDSQD